MNGKLTKAEIIENIHDKLGTDRKDIHAVIDGFFDEVKDSLGKGMTAELRGFGNARERRKRATQRPAKSCQ